MGHRILICRTWRCEIWDTGLKYTEHRDVKYGTQDFNMRKWRCEIWDTGF